MLVLVLSARERYYSKYFKRLNLDVIPVDMREDGWDQIINEYPEAEVVIADSREAILQALQRVFPKLRPIVFNPKSILIGADLKQPTTRNVQIINATEDGWLDRLKLTHNKVPIVIANNEDRLRPILERTFPGRMIKVETKSDEYRSIWQKLVEEYGRDLVGPFTDFSQPQIDPDAMEQVYRDYLSVISVPADQAQENAIDIDWENFGMKLSTVQIKRLFDHLWPERKVLTDQAIEFTKPVGTSKEYEDTDQILSEIFTGAVKQESSRGDDLALFLYRLYPDTEGNLNSAIEQGRLDLAERILFTPYRQGERIINMATDEKWALGRMIEASVINYGRSHRESKGEDFQNVIRWAIELGWRPRDPKIFKEFPEMWDYVKEQIKVARKPRLGIISLKIN